MGHLRTAVFNFSLTCAAILCSTVEAQKMELGELIPVDDLPPQVSKSTEDPLERPLWIHESQINQILAMAATKAADNRNPFVLQLRLAELATSAEQAEIANGEALDVYRERFFRDRLDASYNSQYDWPVGDGKDLVEAKVASVEVEATPEAVKALIQKIASSFPQVREVSANFMDVREQSESSAQSAIAGTLFPQVRSLRLTDAKLQTEVSDLGIAVLSSRGNTIQIWLDSEVQLKALQDCHPPSDHSVKPSPALEEKSPSKSSPDTENTTSYYVWIRNQKPEEIKAAIETYGGKVTSADDDRVFFSGDPSVKLHLERKKYKVSLSDAK